MPVSRRARGSVWVLIKRALVMNELVRRVCMTMELPNYGFELITLSPLHAISMCQGGQDSQRAVPSPHPSARQGVCTAPAMPECGPRCPVPRVWGQRCRQRQPGVAAPPQGPPLPASGLAALAPTAGHPSPGIHELVPSQPHGTHRALFPASPGCLLSPTAPPRPSVPKEPMPSCARPVSSTAWGEGPILAPAWWRTRGSPSPACHWDGVGGTGPAQPHVPGLSLGS